MRPFPLTGRLARGTKPGLDWSHSDPPSHTLFEALGWRPVFSHGSRTQKTRRWCGRRHAAPSLLRAMPARHAWPSAVDVSICPSTRSSFAANEVPTRRRVQRGPHTPFEARRHPGLGTPPCARSCALKDCKLLGRTLETLLSAVDLSDLRHQARPSRISPSFTSTSGRPPRPRAVLVESVKRLSQHRHLFVDKLSQNTSHTVAVYKPPERNSSVRASASNTVTRANELPFNSLTAEVMKQAKHRHAVAFSKHRKALEKVKNAKIRKLSKKR